MQIAVATAIRQRMYMLGYDCASLRCLPDGCNITTSTMMRRGCYIEVRASGTGCGVGPLGHNRHESGSCDAVSLLWRELLGLPCFSLAWWSSALFGMGPSLFLETYGCRRPHDAFWLSVRPVGDSCGVPGAFVWRSCGLRGAREGHSRGT